MNAKLFSIKALALFFLATMFLFANGFAQNKSQTPASKEQKQLKKDVDKEQKNPAVTVSYTSEADPKKNLVQSSKVTVTETNFSTEKEVEITNAETPYLSPEKKAVYIDGNQELFIAVGKNTIYPKELMKQKVQGIVVLQIIVEKDGSITHPQVIAPVHPKLDQAALNVIPGLKGFKPAQHKGEVVRSYFTIPVPFLFEVK
jgi:TonB family protein